MMNKNSKIYIAGHNGLVGSAILRYLQKKKYNNLIFIDKKDLNLENQLEVDKFFGWHKPEFVFLCAAKVGGIHANNTYPAEFIYSNLTIQTNIIHSCHMFGVHKLCFLGSSCIYRNDLDRSIKEEDFMSGPLEPTNDAYAIAKIAGIKMVQAYNKQYDFNGISLMPCNQFGINDNFNLETAHVLPALIRKFHEAKINKQPSVTLWGSGSALREFLYVDDLADASVFLMQKYNSPEIINVGYGSDISIRDLAELIKNIVKYNGLIVFDASKPTGTLRKLMDSNKLRQLGWKSKTTLEDGIKKTYEWFVINYENIRK